MTMLASDSTEQVIEERIQPTYGYYRQPDGFITLSPATELEELHYIKEGWTSLHQYGRVEITSEYVADHPLEGLFVLGGAHELSERQIYEQGLYLHPPLVPSCGKLLNQYHKRHRGVCWLNAKPVQFPQLATMTDLGPFPCRFCEAQKPTRAARDQHEGVVHKTEKGNIQTGEVLAEALLRGGMKPPGQEPQGDVSSILEELARLRAKLESLEARPKRSRRPR